MRTPEQVVWDFVQRWLEKAQRDLKAAELLLEGEFEDYETVVFHAQQAAEKLIKAFLVQHQIEFPKTHDIKRLRGLITQVDKGTATALARADELTPYGVEFRYPGELGQVSHAQAEQAINLARQVQEVILKALKSYLDAGRPT